MAAWAGGAPGGVVRCPPPCPGDTMHGVPTAQTVRGGVVGRTPRSQSTTLAPGRGGPYRVPMPPPHPAPDDDPLVRVLVERIVAEAAPLRVVLFGSRAAGTARPDSDVDLLVVMPDGTPRRRAMVEIGARLPILDVDVDLLVATPDVLDRHRDNPGLVYREILRTGRDLYTAPPDVAR